MLFFVNWASVADVDAINDDHVDIDDLSHPDGVLVEAPTSAEAIAFGERHAAADWEDYQTVEKWVRMGDGLGSAAYDGAELLGWVQVRPVTIASHDE